MHDRKQNWNAVPPRWMLSLWVLLSCSCCRPAAHSPLRLDAQYGVRRGSRLSPPVGGKNCRAKRLRP